MNAWKPDPRTLFLVVVEDITTQILTGALRPGERIASARQMAEVYGVSVMTAQRALRELQTVGATYGAVGRGTFVRPDAIDQLAGSHQSANLTDVPGPALTAQLTAYIALCHDLTGQLLGDEMPSRSDVQNVVAQLRRAAITHAASLTAAEVVPPEPT